MARAGIKVEVHSHDFPVVEFSYVDEYDTVERRQTPNDLTRRVTAVSIKKTDTGVDESINFTFKCSFEEIGTLVNVGDWVVVRDASGVADAWGHVDEVSYSVGTDSGSGAVSCTGNVTCGGWFSLLAKTEIYVPVGVWKSIGTAFEIGDWMNLLIKPATEIGGFAPSAGAREPKVGEAFETFHRAVLRIRLPPSLGGEWLGDAIPVVHDFNTSQKYTAGDRIVEPVVGNTIGVPRQMQFNFQQTSIYEIYENTWVPDRSMVSLFPSLEVGHNSDSLSAIPGTEPPSALAKVLNARPVVFYCMKPFRAEPLGKSQMAYAGFDAHDIKVNTALPSFSNPRKHPTFTNPIIEDSTYIMSKIFNEVTWKPTVKIPKRSWRSLKLRYDDRKRVNITAINLGLEPGNSIEATRDTGLPIANKRSVENHGARIKKVSWSFQKPSREVSATNPIAFWRTIAAEAMQLNINNHLMASGTFVMNSADVIDAQRTKFVRLGAGQVFELEIGRSGHSNLLGYVSSLETTYQVGEDGDVSAYTVVNFERGVAADNKLVQFGKVPVPAGAENVYAPPDPPTLRRTIPPSTGTEPCSSGAPYGRWPSSVYDIDWSVVPEQQLKEWGESRNFYVSSHLSSEGKKYAVILLAALYTVEKYWRQVHPTCRIDVSNSYRPDTNHGTSHRDGGAADWTLIVDPTTNTRMTVFQQWACLNLLATEGRIPFGGRGLYLNLTSTGIVKGLITYKNDPTADPCNPANAGIALGSSRYPRGGSADTHYDLRGSFGFSVTRADGSKTSRETSWLWANTTGGLVSDYRLGDSGLGGGTAVYGVVHPKIKAYFLGAWRFDRHLPGITTDVPNVMQVLGQDGSCFAYNIRV
jgi:hypothetical protein